LARAGGVPFRFEVASRLGSREGFMEPSPELQNYVNQVTAALSPLPDGYYVEGDEPTGSVLVCCKFPEPSGLGFVITAKRLAEGGYLDMIEDRFADLVQAVESGAVPEPRATPNEFTEEI
jgi:hypothetical protein